MVELASAVSGRMCSAVMHVGVKFVGVFCGGRRYGKD